MIKPFRPNAQWDVAKAKSVWQALSNAIKEIHKERAGSLSFEELYRNAYNLVLQKHGDLLYRGVSEQVKNHLRLVGKRLLKRRIVISCKKLTMLGRNTRQQWS